MKHYFFPRMLMAMFAAMFLFLPIAKLYANNASLLVEITRIKDIQGQLHYQLFTCPTNEKTPWHELTPLETGQFVISEKTLQLRFSTLRRGQYIVRVFQDSNANGQLDFSRSGIPKEATGFSNNPNLLLGYPTPQNSCINYDEHDIASHLVTIKLNNKKKRRRKIR